MVIKSRRMSWKGYMSGLREKRNTYRILEGKLEEKRPLGKPGVCEIIILKWVLKKYYERVGQLKIRTSSGIFGQW